MAQSTSEARGLGVTADDDDGERVLQNAGGTILNGVELPIDVERAYEDSRRGERLQYGLAHETASQLETLWKNAAGELSTSTSSRLQRALDFDELSTSTLSPSTGL